MQENIINLIDENGVESQFEIILTLEAEGKEYAILMPVEEEEEAEEALVFRIDQDEQGEILVPLEDDKEYEIYDENNEKIGNITGTDLEKFVLDKKKEIDSLYSK